MGFFDNVKAEMRRRKLDEASERALAFEMVEHEIQSGEIVAGLMAECMAACLGDSGRAQWMYRGKRAEHLIEEMRLFIHEAPKIAAAEAEREARMRAEEEARIARLEAEEAARVAKLKAEELAEEERLLTQSEWGEGGLFQTVLAAIPLGFIAVLWIMVIVCLSHYVS